MYVQNIITMSNNPKQHFWSTNQISTASKSLDTNVDPIIRRLLLLGKLRQPTTTANNNNTQHLVGIEIERLKQVKQLLILLRRSLDDIHDNTIDSDKENTAPSNCIVKILNQLNGVSVPLFNILQQQQQHNSNNKHRKQPILQSANYACMEESALTLATVWKIRQRVVNKRDETSLGSIKSLVFPSLVSCAIALSTLQISNEKKNEPEPVDNTCQDEKKSSEGSIQNDQALDHGEDTAKAILLCMQSFFDIDDAAGKQDGQDLAKEVGSAMGGALVARLVQGCLSLLPQGTLNKDSDDDKIHRKDNTALQLEALKTLQTLIQGIPFEGLWRSILPGCFAGLYRTSLSQLRYSSASSSYKVASSSVQVLLLLLKQSLSSKSSTDKSDNRKDGNESSIQSITASLMAAVQSTNPKVEDASADKFPSQLKNEVNKRLVGPISVLLSLLPTNRSWDVRRSGLYLCQLMMVETRSVWTASNIKTLERKALEYCLMMLGDDNVEVSRTSRDVLGSYKTHLGASSWKRQLSKTIVPTILELVESLPAFAKSGREADVTNHLRLIDGYLVISFRGMTDDFDIEECLIEKRKSDAGSALSCSEAVEVVKRSFSGKIEFVSLSLYQSILSDINSCLYHHTSLVLFTPDIETITCSPMVEIDSNSSKMTLYNNIENNNSRYRFLYLQDETVDAARKTVHLFAKVLGAKRCAFVIDAYCSDMFQACSRLCSDKLLTNVGLDRRLQWCGQCVFMAELLRGMSVPPKLSSRSTLHVFSSLASAVLPVIVSEPLWTLQTTSGIRSSHDGTGLDDQAQSVSIMNHNAILVSLLMGVIHQFTHIIGGENIQLLLPTILVPLLERSSPIGNHSFVQSAAVGLLQDITVSIGYNDISSLLASNFDYLIDAISLRMTKNSREMQVPMERSLVGVVDVILQSIVYHGSPDKGKGGEPLTAGHVSMVKNLLTCLLNHFDRQQHTANVLSTFDMARVFLSMNTFMDSAIDSYIQQSCINHTHKTSDNEEEETDDWFQRLDAELNVDSAAYYASEEDDNTDNGMFSEQEDIDNVADDNSPPVDTGTDDQEKTDFLQEISSINSTLSRCCYLLCYDDLRIQVVCCETILSGFQSLGKIGLFRRKSKGDAANNPLLPAIGEFWPSIKARLQSASRSLVSVNTLSRSDLSLRHTMATDQDQGPSRTGLEVLISKLLLIISELCTSSDGFFTDRYQNDVYPIITKLTHDILPRDINSMGALSKQKQTNLILPILSSFKSTFESSCRYGLASLIPSAGTMLFPLLSREDEIGDEAINTLKIMLNVDSDSLWRGLHTLSRRPFPVNPISGRQQAISISGTPTLTVSKKRDCDLILAQKACELLDYIEHLPEQEIQ